MDKLPFVAIANMHAEASNDNDVDVDGEALLRHPVCGSADEVMDGQRATTRSEKHTPTPARFCPESEAARSATTLPAETAAKLYGACTRRRGFTTGSCLASAA
ncbi:hypothetical protein CFE70_000697 [Pyrenophora teres f. teres 0-1]